MQLTDDIPDRQPLEEFRIRRDGFSISSLLVSIAPVLSVKVGVMVLSSFSVSHSQIIAPWSTEQF